MKLRHLLLGSAAMLVSASAANAAINTPTGWYLSLGAGANWLEEGAVNELDSGSLQTANEFDWDSGFIGAAAIGYDFGNHWRAEFEVAYRSNEADGFCSSGGECSTVSDADVWELSQMINVFYDFHLGGNWSAAVGAGVGGTLVVFDPGNSGNFDNSNRGVDGDDYVLSGQLLAEAGYRLTERWQLFAQYRYMIMDDPEIQDATEIQETWEMEKTDHSVLIGVRFDLQRDGYTPPPAPQPQARSPKQFIVFFGFNKANLTPEAHRVVQDAAAAAKEYGSASIVIIGHTDTSGSVSYNEGLSIRRAGAVKNGLAAEGIPANMISTAGRGESELMVQTGDGVKEPQNRRATIDLN
jgi:OOP family OmpA-OmpF porin